MISLRNLSEIECFRAVAKLRSFSEAAKELKMNKNSVSRYISNLEDKLEDKLFRRTTREVFLTAFGENFYRQTERFWESLLHLESEVSQDVKEPYGVVKVLVSSVIANNFLAEKIKGFQKEYPKISFDIVFSDGRYNDWKLDKKKIEILFGFPHIPEVNDEWKYKALFKTDNVLVGAPSLLQRYKPVKKAEDLLKLPWITHSHRSPKNSLRLKKGKSIKTSQPVLSTNSLLQLKDFCKAGLGLALLGENMVEEELKRKELISLLPDLDYLEYPLHLYCRPEDYASPKIRAVMEWSWG